ncbi:MAG: DoxX family membrane protein [Bifidobacteriaceae bacterium]|jgi:uncharacterized membrane protein YphA (DoxX/SURF4 family)|nr:DoxX family membrane protein [Bifidobacteriaceae bacterium]
MTDNHPINPVLYRLIAPSWLPGVSSIVVEMNAPADTTKPIPTNWRTIQPWLSLLVRLGLAFIAIRAAIPKFQDLAASQRSVAAYELPVPASINQLIGVGLPILELVVALLFISGLLTRYTSVIFGVMLLLFIAGIASAWARGLNIDCGCFSPGGALSEGEVAKYGQEILRDVGFLALTVFLTLWPQSKFSLDGAMGLDPVPKADPINTPDAEEQ